MIRATKLGLVCLAVAATWGCGQAVDATSRNAFLTLTQTFGSDLIPDADGDGIGGGAPVDPLDFRAPMTITLMNMTTTGDLSVKLAAWVNLSSVRTEVQEDALFRSGYVRLQEDVEIGTVFKLPAGTFVLGGGGLAGARSIFLRAADGPPDFGEDPGGEQVDFTPRVLTLEFVTPDVILLFDAPPISCDSVGFRFTAEGQTLTDTSISAVGDVWGGATSVGGQKTLAQYSAYQCSPFLPGLHLKQSGGAFASNEYLEGDSITVQFTRFVFPNTGGIAAQVTIGGEAPEVEP